MPFQMQGMPGYSCAGSANQRARSGTGTCEYSTHSHGLSRRDDTLKVAAAPLCLHVLFSPAIGRETRESQAFADDDDDEEAGKDGEEEASRTCVIVIVGQQRDT